MYKFYIKPFFDFIFALTLLIVTLPLLIIFALLLAINNRGTPFFFQTRPGLYEKPFKIFKFKTMTDLRDDKGNLLPDFKRITFWGNVARKTSVDELLQLINILKGDMSFVGPRPLLMQYLPLYSSEQKKRHNVKPGITGWAQVNGRNAISWTKKFELDAWYEKNISFSLDLKILMLTVKNVLVSKDINQSENTTAEFFNGKN